MTTKKKAIIVDLDSTFVNVDHRAHHVSGAYKKADFDTFYRQMHLDPPNQWCVNMVKLYHKAGYTILFVTGRPSDYREQSQVQIETYAGIVMPYYHLFMRPAGDHDTHDTVIKETLYREHIEPKYDVEIVIEDRSRVVAKWRSMGLVCLQCYPNDF